MFETLFGEGQYGLKFVVAFIVVLALIALTAWLVRRFGAERLGTGTTRGRQPRLAVIDAASVDGRRRLVLIRRDNVEHLMMIGGPTDVVVEANIVRAAAPGARAAGPARTGRDRHPAARRSARRGQHVAAAAGAGAGTRAAAAHRAAGFAARRAAAHPAATAALHDRRRGAGVDRRTGAGATAASAAATGAAAPRRACRQRIRLRAWRTRSPARQPPQPEPAASSEPRPVRRGVAHAARAGRAIPRRHHPLLRRHRRRPPNRSSIRPPTRTSPRWPTGSKPHCAVRASRRALPSRRRETAPTLRGAGRRSRGLRTRRRQQQRARRGGKAGRAAKLDRRAPTDGRAAPKSSLYDSLEQEMASLLGRPNGKP